MLSAAASPSTEASNPAVCKREQTICAATGLKAVKTVTRSILLGSSGAGDNDLFRLRFVKQTVRIDFLNNARQAFCGRV